MISQAYITTLHNHAIAMMHNFMMFHLFLIFSCLQQLKKIQILEPQFAG
jgi:hypothetical protein